MVNAIDLSDILSEEDLDLSQIEELESLKMYLYSLGYGAGSSVARVVLEILGCTSIEQLEALENIDFTVNGLTVPEYRLFMKKVQGTNRLIPGSAGQSLDLYENVSSMKFSGLSNVLSVEDLVLSQIEERESLKLYLQILGYNAGSSVTRVVLDVLGCHSIEQLEALEDRDYAMNGLSDPEYRLFVKKLRGTHHLMHESGVDQMMDAYMTNSSMEISEDFVDISAQLSEEDLKLSRIEELESLKMYLYSLGYGAGTSVARVVLEILGCASVEHLEALEEEDFAMSGLAVPEYRLFVKKVRGTRRFSWRNDDDDSVSVGDKQSNCTKRKSLTLRDIEIREIGAKRQRGQFLDACSNELTGQVDLSDGLETEILTASQCEWIYVIACEHGCIYVGRTHKNPSERLQEHRSGQGAQWTRLHKPLKFLVDPRPVRSTDDVGLDEDYETKIWIKQKGIPFVRGGSYAHPQLSIDQIRSLERELYHNAEACWRCGHIGHYAISCYAKRHVNGTSLFSPHGKSAYLAAVEDAFATSPKG